MFSGIFLYDVFSRCTDGTFGKNASAHGREQNGKPKTAAAIRARYPVLRKNVGRTAKT